ncbi:fibronectin type III domain-containing protein [Hymenobacter pini]|uniref:fibronectin type III domain-containing protein n=1 Tax=Hymenobacter pini TaxID=2880879 RepID=UPI001CF35713|nr:fibronectin type III domain-containing protein [Hymenobacter pini]MCA8830289.1 fibronectin type III domain-containing protein [Hymenobacter pini]
MATQAQNLQALQLLRDETQATLVSGANLSGPGLSALLVRLMNIMSEEVQRGGTVRYGVGVPSAAMGADNDTYTDKATGYEYVKAGGNWIFQFSKKGQPGTTPVKGRDYVDGQDGLDGNVIVDKGYAPTSTDNIGYQEGDQWFHTKSTSSYDRYAHISGQWRLVFSSGTATVTPTPNPLVATLTTSTASVTVGTAVTYTAGANGGTGPYTYATQATNTATGAPVSIGSAASGSWTPQTAGNYELTATVTDSAGAVKISPVRQVSVTAATVTPTAPAPVSQLDTTAGNGQVVVNLEAPASNGAAIQSYRYEYRPGTSGNWLVAGTTANLSHPITGLTNGVSYQFRAFATNSAGTSTAGAVVTATPTAGAGSAGYADIVVFGLDQSNGSGLSPSSGLPAEYKTADSRVKIWNKTANAVQTYQVGVNDNPLTPALVPGYERGFGPDAAFVKAWRDDAANIGKQLFIFKKDVTPPQSTNSATCAFWQSDLFPVFKQEWDAYKAALEAQGYIVRVAVLISGLGEGDANNPDFLTEYTALINRFQSEISGIGVRKLIAKKQHAAPNQAAAQAQYVEAHSEATLVDLPNPAFLSDGLHYTADSMIRLGALEYSVFSGSYTPPPPPPPPVGDGPTYTAELFDSLRNDVSFVNDSLVTNRPNGSNYAPAAKTTRGVPFGSVGGVKATVPAPVPDSVKSIYFVLGVSESQDELPEYQVPMGVEARPGTDSGYMLRRILGINVGEGPNNAPIIDNVPFGSDFTLDVDDQGAVILKKRLAGGSWSYVRQLGNVTGKAYFHLKLAGEPVSGMHKPMSHGLV